MSKPKQFTRALVLICLCGLAWGGFFFWPKIYTGKLGSLDYEPPPPGMVLVPAGDFLIGSDDPQAEPDEKPLRKVFQPAFYIDRFEVSNRRYQQFKKDHRFPPGEEDLPVTFVLKREAEEYCRLTGKRLPTNAEWEKAARGTNGWVYPWGNEFKAGYGNINPQPGSPGSNSVICKLPSRAIGARGKLPGGSFPKGASPYGCEDMSGNVWEWVSDVWVDKNFLGLPQGGESRGILRGGAYHYSPVQARASHHGFEAVDATCHDVGFRAAMNAIPKRSKLAADH